MPREKKEIFFSPEKMTWTKRHSLGVLHRHENDWAIWIQTATNEAKNHGEKGLSSRNTKEKRYKREKDRGGIK